MPAFGGPQDRAPGLVRRLAGLSPALLLAGFLGAAPGLVQAEPGYYQGKTVRMIIGGGAGGGYDLWGRLVGNHIGKHLPGNPTVVPENMPGAGSLVAANYIYNKAPKDGTVLGIITRDTPLEPLLKNTSAQFDPRKFTWIGSPTTETNLCFAHVSSDVKSLDDLRSKELIVGDTGPGTGSQKYPRALPAILGLKFKDVSGFPSSADVFLAIERGELEGMCESLDSVAGKRPDWIAQNKIVMLFQGGAKPNPHLAGVPFILDLAKTPEQKQALTFLYAGQFFGRPFVAPPDLPPEQVQMLQSAFDATMKDPDFLAEAKKYKVEVDPESGPELAAFINEIEKTPPAVIDQIIALTK